MKVGSGLWKLCGGVAVVLMVLWAAPALADDCDGDGIDDAYAIEHGIVPDCNENGVPDYCDIYIYCTSHDFADSGIPDECEISEGLLPDCNGNEIDDATDIWGAYDYCDQPWGATSLDCNNNGIPDECDLDCNGNGIPDECDIRDNTSYDLNGNWIPDECDLAAGTSEDCNENGVPDEAEFVNGVDLPSAVYGFNMGGVIPPIGVATGDMNGDQHIDVVTANRAFPSGQSVAVFLNQGDGTFATGVIYYVGMDGEDIALADFDHDADLDVAVTYRDSSTYKVAVFFNDGNGVLTLSSTIPNTHIPIGIAAGDLTGDNYPEIVTGNQNHNVVSVMVNDGTGHFPTQNDITIGGRPMIVRLADVDNDDDLDLIVGAQSSSEVAVAMNNGNGTFAAPTMYAMGGWYAATDILPEADFNDDGFLDIALAFQYTRSVGVMLNHGDGTFTQPIGFGPAAGNPIALAVGDFDNDGTTDLASTLSPPWPNGPLFIYRNQGTLLAPQSFFAGYSCLSLATGDFNGDGRDDLVTGVYQESRIRVFLNNEVPPISTDNNHNGVPDTCEGGDLNCDGTIDNFDINPFVMALTNPAAYHAAYPTCDIMKADCNGDGVIDNFDINPFVALLTGP